MPEKNPIDFLHEAERSLLESLDQKAKGLRSEARWAASERKRLIDRARWRMNKEKTDV